MNHKTRSHVICRTTGPSAVAVAMVMFSCVAALAQPAADAKPGTGAIPPAIANRERGEAADVAMRAELSVRRISAEYQGITFHKAIDELRAATGLNIQPNWSRIAAAGVERDSIIDVRLRDVPVSVCLRSILDQAGTDKAELEFDVLDGIVVISTAQDLSRSTIMRIYDVSDLMGSRYGMRRFANTPVLRLELVGGETAGGKIVSGGGSASAGGAAQLFGGGGAGGMQQASGTAAPTPEPQAADFVDMTTLIDLIQSTTLPESWRDAGGNVGGIRSFQNALLITHTRQAHLEITDLLARLRAAQPAAMTCESAIVRMPLAESTAWRGGIGAAFPRLTTEEFAKTLSGGPAGRLLFRASTAGRNGERLWFSNLTQRDALASYQPVLGDGVCGFMPIMSEVTEGLELLVVPLMRPDESDMTLDVQLAWLPTAAARERIVRVASEGTTIHGGGPQVQPEEYAGATAKIEQFTRQMRTVSTLLQGRPGEAIALSIPPQPGEEAQTSEDWLLIHVATGKTSAP